MMQSMNKRPEGNVAITTRMYRGVRRVGFVVYGLDKPDSLTLDKRCSHPPFGDLQLGRVADLQPPTRPASPPQQIQKPLNIQRI
jgi:hypothetical protein